jgi:plastocyanin
MKANALLIMAVLLAGSLAGCSGDSMDGSTGNGDSPDEGSTGKSVDISGYAFSPSGLTVAVGDQVTWTNLDSASHTATANDATFDSGNLAKGESYSYTFTTVGTIAYHCDLHSSMSATITVE